MRRSVPLNSRKLLTYNFSLLLLVISLYGFYYTWSNTLFKNGNWDSAKVKLEKGLMGSWSFLLTHRALAQGHLDPGTWQGYQHISYKHAEELDSICFDFKLRKDSYFTYFFSSEADTLMGIRFSNHTDYPSALLRVSDHRFIQRKEISCSITEGWNHVSACYLRGGIRVCLNQVLLSFLPYNLAGKKTLLAFRGGYNSTLIDDIEGSRTDGSTFKETFGGHPPRLTFFILLFCLASLIYLLFPIVQPTAFIITVNASLLACAACIYFLFYGQMLYPKEWMVNFRSKKNTIETWEQVYRDILAKQDTTTSSDLRITFIGSSQTWGAGASCEEKTFVRQYEKMIQQNFRKSTVQVINTGISSLNSELLLKYYKDNPTAHLTDLCIINLGCNDFENSGYRSNLKEFLQINAQNQVETIFITEPIAEANSKYRNNQYITKSIADSSGKMLLDMQTFMDGEMENGYLYWDFIHLTNYGQELFAEELFRQSKDLLNQLIENKKTDAEK